MNDVLLLILTLSLSGSIIALLVFFIKPLIKNRLSKSIQYYIWLIVLLRLLLPISFENSLMNNYYLNESKVIQRAEVTQQSIKAIDTQDMPISQTQKKVIDAKDMSETPSMVIGTKDMPISQTAVKLIFTDEKPSFIGIVWDNLFLIWLIGIVLTFSINLFSYCRFIIFINKSNIKAGAMEADLLRSILKNKKEIKLFRNNFIGTPMLLGLAKPRIIIPDRNYTEVQLRNILAHEVVHLRYFDILVKWLTLIAASVHWFNPLMYFIKKEINHSCELACDERVIKNLDKCEKQFYGETLLSVVAENNPPIGALSTTMCEEKRTLKERLISIMNYSKKSRTAKIVSVILVLMLIGSAAVLGASIGNKLPPSVYISSEFQKTKEAVMGDYSFRSGGYTIHREVESLAKYEYSEENTIYAGAGEQLILCTQKIKLDKSYAMSLSQVEVYKDGKLYESTSNTSGLAFQELRIQTPVESGEYLYNINVLYPQKGKVEYGFVVRVDLPVYNLSEIEKNKSPYVGNHVKVMGVLGNLPMPFNNSIQRYISIRTSKSPYRLTAYYEAKDIIALEDMTANSKTLQDNALVLFYMIDNLDEISFMYRSSPSTIDLEPSEYEKEYSFTREQIIKIYGKTLFEEKDLTKLKHILEGK